MLAAKDPKELDVSYRRKRSTPCYSLFLSTDCNRQTVGSDVDVRTADNSLDCWIPVRAAESLFKALAVELGASQQHWHVWERDENNEAACSGFIPIRAFMKGIQYALH